MTSAPRSDRQDAAARARATGSRAAACSCPRGRARARERASLRRSAAGSATGRWRWKAAPTTRASCPWTGVRGRRTDVRRGSPLPPRPLVRRLPGRGGGGVARVSPRIARRRVDMTPYLAAGLRLAAEVPLARAWLWRSPRRSRHDDADAARREPGGGLAYARVPLRAGRVGHRTLLVTESTRWSPIPGADQSGWP